MEDKDSTQLRVHDHLHDFGDVLGWPFKTFFWALIISLSRVLAHL